MLFPLYCAVTVHKIIRFVCLTFILSSVKCITDRVYSCSFCESVTDPGSAGAASACSTGGLGLTPGSGRPPGEGSATHSGILAWRTPRTVGSVGRQRVGHDWATLTSLDFQCSVQVGFVVFGRVPELGQALGKRVNEMLYLYRGLPLRVGEMGAPDFTDRRPGGPSAEPRREVPEEGPCARGLCLFPS